MEVVGEGPGADARAGRRRAGLPRRHESRRPRRRSGAVHVGRGARDLEGFQAQAAEHYAPAPVFYSAYRSHSLVNLLRYLEFRDQLLEEIGA